MENKAYLDAVRNAWDEKGEGHVVNRLLAHIHEQEEVIKKLREALGGLAANADSARNVLREFGSNKGSDWGLLDTEYARAVLEETKEG